MADEEHVSVFKSGKDAIDRWRKHNPDKPLSLSGADLSGVELSEASLPDVDLSGANLSRTKLTKITFRNATCVGANFTGARLIKCHFGGSVKANQAQFDGAILHNVTLGRADLREASFEGCESKNLNTSNADMRKANLKSAQLLEAHMTYADLREATLDDATITSAAFEHADLRKASLVDAVGNARTSMADARVAGCVISRFSLETFGAQRAGLTGGQLMEMDVRHGVATLRQSFSGFFQWVHVVALVLFVSPYVAFILHHWTMSRAIGIDEDKSVRMIEGLVKYIWSGGADWRTWTWAPLAFTSFLIAATYNVLRAVLLWKTKTLELQEEAGGFPVKFALKEGWGRTFKAAKIAFIFNLVAVAYHTTHFLWTQRIPT